MKLGELDKAIAELRGDKCQYYSILPLELQGKSPACQRDSMCFPEACCREEGGEGYCLAYTDKPYSTDIRYAMELWDEMKAAGNTIGLKTEGHKLVCSIGYLDSYEDTEAHAIAGAYYKWKSGQ